MVSTQSWMLQSISAAAVCLSAAVGLLWRHSVDLHTREVNRMQAEIIELKAEKAGLVSYLLKDSDVDLQDLLNRQKNFRQGPSAPE